MLALRFSTRAGRVEIASDSDRASNLHGLRGRFASASSLSSDVFDVEIDDLLVNLRELATWPRDDQDIRWQPELLALVETNAADASTLQERLGRDHEPVPQLPPSFTSAWTAPLTDFQQRDLAKLLELNHGANFSVPGAGKTRVGLGLVVARRFQGVAQQALVVCPKSAYESWQFEIATCLEASPLSVAVFEGGPVPPTDVVLVNYERLPDSVPALMRWMRAAPTVLILDEAHRMKLGAAGAWGAACLALAPYASARLILSGTPAPNGARDLENLFSFVWPGQGRGAVQRAIDGQDLRTASESLRPLFVRTTKGELGLPPVDTVVRRVDLPPLHRELYGALVGLQSTRVASGSSEAADLGRVLLYLLMAATTPALLATGASRYEPLPYRVPPLEPPTGSSLAALLKDLPHYEMSPKYKEVVGIVAANAAAGRKTLIWSTFVRNLTSLAHLLEGYGPAVIHGGSEDRESELRRFREDPACMVLLSNPATLGEGVSLHQVCHDAIYVDRDFAAGRFLQSLDRIHRLGLPADTETRITILVANETIDELVEQRLGLKLRFMGGVLDDPAVLELGDLDEEPSETAGMDASDIAALLGYLADGAPD